MMFITPDDLAPFAAIPPAKAEAMIEDAEAKAQLLAPALAEGGLGVVQVAAVRAILRDAILRWNDRGSGALTQTSIGQVQVSNDTRYLTRNLFTQDEVAQLRAISSERPSGGAFSISTIPRRV